MGLISTDFQNHGHEIGVNGSQVFSKRRKTGKGRSDAHHVSSKGFDNDFLWGDVHMDDNVWSNSEQDLSIHRGYDTIITRALKAVGGKHWVAVRKAICLFPLRFDPSRLEQEFADELSTKFYKWGAVTQTIVAAAFFLTLILPSLIFMCTGVLPTRPTQWLIAWSFCIGLIVLSFFVVLSPIFIRGWRKKFRLLLYFCTFVSATILFWLDGIFWTYKDKMRPEQFLSAALQDTPIHFISLITIAIVVNIVLPSMSSESFHFNVAIIISFLLEKAVIKQGAEALAVEITYARGIGFGVVFVVTWIGRYVGELQERANKVRFLESHARVERVRHLLKSKSEEGLELSGIRQTPAEHVVGLLDQVVLTLNLFKDEGHQNKTAALFDDLMHNLEEIIKALTSHETLMDMMGPAISEGKGDTSEDQIVLAFANPTRKLDRRLKIGANSEKVWESPNLSMVSIGRAKMNAKNEFMTPHIPYRWKSLEFALEEKMIQRIGADVDFLADEITSPAGPLLEVGMAVCRAELSGVRKDVSETTIVQFLYTVESLTFSNVHTNSTAAARSTHYFILLLKCTGVMGRLTDVEKLTLLMTSVSRYIGHGGFGDKFHQSACSRMSVLFNDKHVNSQIAASCLLKIATLSGADLWAHIDPIKRHECRKLVIILMMTLDYRVNFEVLSQVRLRRSSPFFDPAKDAEDRSLVARLCFKVSDFSVDFAVWDIHYKLTLRRTLEMFEQGDLERKLGMPITPFCDRGKLHLWPAWTCSYYSQVIVPFFEEVGMVDVMGNVSQVLLPRVRSARDRWEKIKSGADRFESPLIQAKARSAGVMRGVQLWRRVMLANSLKEIITDDLPSIEHQHMYEGSFTRESKPFFRGMADERKVEENVIRTTPSKKLWRKKT